MDSLKFASTWSGSVSGAKVNVKMTGLQIEGAMFDGTSLRENSHNSPPVSNVPAMVVSWIPKVGRASIFDLVLIFAFFPGSPRTVQRQRKHFVARLFQSRTRESCYLYQRPLREGPRSVAHLWSSFVFEISILEFLNKFLMKFCSKCDSNKKYYISLVFYEKNRVLFIYTHCRRKRFTFFTL